MKTARCLCCGEILKEEENLYHARCMKKLFRSMQPKLSLHLERGEAQGRSRLTLVGLEGDYILKPQTPQWPSLPEAEHFCMLLARKCGITTAEFGLIPLKSGELAYITRRMDRTEKGALHMEDFCQILNKMTDQKYNGSMEQIGKAIRSYSDVAGLDLIRFFELAVFCFLTGNSDMHLKNFSLIRLPDGHYELSPAYDLVSVRIIMPEDKEDLALTLQGRKSNLKRADFERFGAALQLSEIQIRKAVSHLVLAVSEALPTVLQASFLPQEMQEQIASLVRRQTQRLQVENG